MPGPPTNITATPVSLTEIRLNWQHNYVDELGFELYRRKEGDQYWGYFGTVPYNTTSYLDKNLTENTTYSYYLRTVSPSGTSVNSAEASATTPNTPPDVPVAPSDLGLTRSSTYIVLTWTDNSTATGPEDGFLIQRDSGGGFVDHATVGRNMRSYGDSGLTRGQLYRYRVRAFNSTGSSAFTEVVEAVTNGNPTVPPSSLTVEIVSGTTARLRWLDNSSNEISFEVTRWDGINRSYRTFSAGGPNTNTYLDESLTPNSRYIYFVSAIGPQGSLGATNQVEIRTPN
jgi:titin